MQLTTVQWNSEKFRRDWRKKKRIQNWNSASVGKFRPVGINSNATSVNPRIGTGVGPHGVPSIPRHILFFLRMMPPSFNWGKRASVIEFSKQGVARKKFVEGWQGWLEKITGRQLYILDFVYHIKWPEWSGICSDSARSNNKVQFLSRSKMHYSCLSSKGQQKQQLNSGLHKAEQQLH